MPKKLMGSSDAGVMVIQLIVDVGVAPIKLLMDVGLSPLRGGLTVILG